MYRAIPVCFILFAFLSGCTHDQASNNPCPNCAVISFSADIIPIFKANCTTNCHTGSPSAAPGRISLDSAIAYAQVMHSGTGFVNAGDPYNSILYSGLLAGNSLHMPISTQLDPCTIQKVYCWIQQGALNN